MGVSLSVSPLFLVLILLLAASWVISFGESERMNRFYMILTSILSAAGITAMILIRAIFMKRLTNGAASMELDSEFIAWATDKFDSFARILIPVAIAIIMALLIALFLDKKKSGYIWTYLTGIVSTMMVVSLLSGLWYGLNTINKFFDIAAYIMQLCIAVFLALHIPLITKRFLARKK